MTKSNGKKIFIVLILALIVGIGVLKLGSEKMTFQEVTRNSKKSSLTVSDDGYIRLDVLFDNSEAKDKEELEFEISLNTHTEDLSKYYYLDKFIELRVGEISIKDGFIWEIYGRGHHVLGTLKIKNSYQGEQIWDENTQELKLIFKNIGDMKEREHWYKI